MRSAILSWFAFGWGVAVGPEPVEGGAVVINVIGRVVGATVVVVAVGFAAAVVGKIMGKPVGAT